jgi:glycosyltransferase involved in cell wall biosynthesis
MISFVVPAYNEERLLGATLDAIHAAARACGEPHEVIVADDASSDRTAEIAEAHGARVVRVHCRQISATRNAGARAACGDLLFFVDADTVIDATVLREALAALHAGAVGGGAPVTFDGRVPGYAKVLLVLLVWSFRVQRLAAGCFLFCTRAAYEGAGGWDEAYFGAEEIVLSRALKRQGRFVVLRAGVLTSGRKLRAYSGRELFGALWQVARQGRRGVQRREGLEIWYGERRNDPP